jgi:hypothetical protein
LSSPVCQTCIIDLYRKMPEQFRPELFDDSEEHRFTFVNELSTAWCGFYYILISNKGICAWPIWPEVNCPYFHNPGKWPVIGLLQDYFHIEAHRPIWVWPINKENLLNLQMQLDGHRNLIIKFIMHLVKYKYKDINKNTLSGKMCIYRLIHGHFRPGYHSETPISSQANMGVSFLDVGSM